MCQRCLDALREFFPAVPAAEAGNFLFSCTCYPCGEPADVRGQLAKLREQTADYQECYAIADYETMEAMERMKEAERGEKKP